MRKTVTFLFVMLSLVLVGGLPLAAQSGPSGSSAPPNVSAQDAIRGRKLILKDGTVQIVSQYQVVGDRVRFYSVERSEWEEIPASLVDWDATRKAATEVSERDKQAIALAHRVDLEEHPGRLDVDAGLGLPPGVLLPSGDGLFAFNGHSLVPVKEDLAKSRLNKGRFVVKLISPVPVVSTRYTIFLPGKRAKARIADSEPVFYYRTGGGTVPQFQLMQAKVKGKDREFAYLDEYMGQKKTDANEIPVKIEPVYRDTYRMIASQDLSPDEYVLAQMLPSTKTVDMYVWDFEIDPSPKSSTKR